MRSRHFFSSLHLAAVAAALALGVTLLTTSQRILAQTAWNAKNATWNVFSKTDTEPVGLQDYTENVQYHLDRMLCYDDTVDNIDHVWGSESREAFDRLIAKSGTPASAIRRSAETFLAWMVKLPDGYCGGNARTSARICRRSDVGRNYLAGKAGQISGASSLTPTLNEFNDAFDTVFTPGQVDITAGWDPALKLKERLEEAAGNRVTHATAKKALQEAAHQLAQLSFAYGIQASTSCNLCYIVNDWLYLRNIAQSTGRQLMTTYEHPNGDKEYFRVAVAPITEVMIKDISPYIRIHRGASANVDLHFTYLEPNGLPQGMDKDSVNARVPVLIAARDLAMLDIVKKLRDMAVDPAKTTISSTNRLMRTLNPGLRCPGFDGSSVDQ